METLVESKVQLNEYVLAHMRTYSPWPARILRILTHGRCEVRFYGDGRT